MDTAAAEIEDYPLHGVSLAAYAAVCAARDEGFALDRVLRIERLEEHDFARAEPKWERRLQASPALLQRYRDLRAAAEDRLSRPISPLHEELGAWVAFAVAYASAADPAGFLGPHGIGPNDLSRLSRAWKHRMAADPSLRERIAALPARLEVSRVQVAAAVLRRSQRGATTDDRPDPAGASFDFSRYAMLAAELEVFPDEASRIHAKLGLGSAHAVEQLTAQFRAALATDARRAEDYRKAHAAALAHARSLAQPSTGEAPEQDGPALPSFLAHPPPRAPSPSVVIDEAKVEAPHPLVATPEAGRTLDVAAILATPLPFAPAASAASVAESIHRAEAQQRASSAPAPAGSTMDVAAILASPALPFSSAPAAHPSAPPPAPPPEPPRTARESFHPPAPHPQLTVAQYASLTVDLAMAPARRAETLLRYRLTEADVAALDAAHKARFLTDPAARAQFDQATATYRAWLSANRRG